MIRTFPLLTVLAIGAGMPAVAQVYIADNFSITSATVSVTGDLHGVADVSGNGVLLLNGTTPQSVNFDGNAISVLEVNNTAGVSLASDLHIGQELRLTNGKVRLGASDLVLDPGAIVSAAGTGKYIVTDGSGAVTAPIANGASFTFPVGATDAASDYTPATVTNASGARAVSVRVQDYTGAGVTVPVPALGVDRAWQIWSSAAGNATVALTHVAATEGANFKRDSAYASQQQQTAGQWSAGTPYAGTNGGFTHSGDFSLPGTAGTTAWFTKLAKASTSVPQLSAADITMDVVPNPFLNEARLQVFSAQARQVRYTLTDVTGKMIVRDALRLPAGASVWTLPVSGLNSGVYLLHVSGTDVDQHFKIIRQ
jgi:hypothetical protein